jgi:NTE family protein
MFGYYRLVFIYLQSKKYLHLFVRSKYGICTGNDFHKWITQILRFNKIESTAQLEQEMRNYQQGVNLRPEREAENISKDSNPVVGSDIILITSDITNQRKVEFPAMAKYYWDDPAAANPADFVRASMAIPIFFEPFIRKVTHAPQSDEGEINSTEYSQRTDMGNPCEVRFVDGGILSNFPSMFFTIPILR